MRTTFILTAVVLSSFIGIMACRERSTKSSGLLVDTALAAEERVEFDVKYTCKGPSIPSSFGSTQARDRDRHRRLRSSGA